MNRLEKNGHTDKKIIHNRLTSLTRFDIHTLMDLLIELVSGCSVAVESRCLLRDKNIYQNTFHVASGDKPRESHSSNDMYFVCGKERVCKCEVLVPTHQPSMVYKSRAITPIFCSYTHYTMELNCMCKMHQC